MAPLARAAMVSTPRGRRLALLDALMGYVASLLSHGAPSRPPRMSSACAAALLSCSGPSPASACLDISSTSRLGHPPVALSRLGSRLPTAALLGGSSLLASLPVPLPASRHGFHNYFVTHLPSSSLHPDSRRMVVPHHHKLPRDASVPHPPASATAVPGRRLPAAPAAPITMPGRDMTVVRIPLNSAKHHYGVFNGRGSRPYNEDTYQAGTIDMPAFAKRAPISLVRSAMASSRQAGEGITADSAAGDPQIFYFAVFDGHGGSECSSFLRDELHAYIEKAAVDFGLPSSLRHHKPRTAAAPGTADAASTAAAPEADSSSSSSPNTASGAKIEFTPDVDTATRLQRELLQEYRETIGGYFRRFYPDSFAPGLLPPPRRRSALPPPGTAPTPEAPAPKSPSTSPVTIDSVLTYAFLRADLDFVSAQANKPDPDDPRIADQPLNNDEILGAPHLPPSGLSIGGPVRFKGGSTASVTFISTPTPLPYWHPTARSTVLVAHVGDTRVLLCETATGLARPLTRDHHPSSPTEARRLTRYAETLVTDSFGEERISGLANSRAFGDMQSKRIGVSAEPEIERVDMGPGEYTFMVLVSDGVSGTLSDQEIVDVVKEARTPEQGARDVVNYATEVSKDGDNATCLVVRLGGWERRSEGGLGSMGTKEIRDARRAEAQDPRRGRM